MFRKISILSVFLSFFLFLPNFTQAQIIVNAGSDTEAASQLIYPYNLAAEPIAFLQVTNTSLQSEVNIHVQIFRSYDADGPGAGAPITLCEERDFFDFLTPGDTHVYTLATPNFPKNEGETAAPTPGLPTTINLLLPVSTQGFVIITPVVSDVDATAISFQNLIGNVTTFSFGGLINAMGRDAVDFATGDVVADGTPLDGTSNGFEVLQPSELIADIGHFANSSEIVGIAFIDDYGPGGLLGYNISPGEVAWTSFIYDFIENPTSCGNNTVSCYLTIGFADNFPQFTTANFIADALCSGVTIPITPVPGATEYGWADLFVSGYDDFENHLAYTFTSLTTGSRWVRTR